MYPVHCPTEVFLYRISMKTDESAPVSRLPEYTTVLEPAAVLIAVMTRKSQDSMLNKKGV